MTPEQFARRRDLLCVYLGYNPESMSNPEVLADLEKLLGLRGEVVEQRDELKDEDRRYFARLLRSYAKYGDHYVRLPSRVEPGDFDRRAEYTNHPEDGEPRPYLLLSEVEIAYERGAIDERIELIDLPGLGARLGADDLLTKTFLPELSGALIFQSAEQVAAREAYELLHMLRNQYRRLTGRVWMVITKFDTLASEHYGQGRSSNIFDNIRKTMEDNHVPLSQVLLVANSYHKKLLGPDGEPRAATSQQKRELLNLEDGPDGQPAPPAAFRAHAELNDAFTKVMEDGGIVRIREVIGRVLAQEVEREVRDDVREELAAVRKALTRVIAGARETSRGDDQIVLKISGWRMRLQMIVQRIGHDPDRSLLEKPGIELIERLRQTFSEILCPPGLTIRPERLRAEHQDVVKVLKKEAMTFGRGEALPGIFRQVSQELAETNRQIGPVRLLGSERGPTRPGRPGGTPGSTTSAGSPRSSNPSTPRHRSRKATTRPPINDHQYRDIMDRKIYLVIHRAIHLVGEMIRVFLESIEAELSTIGGTARGQRPCRRRRLRRLAGRPGQIVRTDRDGREYR